MKEVSQIGQLVDRLAGDIGELCQSGKTWKITLHGGRDGGVKVERTTYDEVRPIRSKPPPKTA